MADFHTWKQILISQKVKIIVGMICHVDGTINWVAEKDRRVRPYLWSFVMESEQVRRIAFPSEINSAFGWRLGMVGNVLRLYGPFAGGQLHFNIWAMEKYGVEEFGQRHSINFDAIFRQTRAC